MVTALSVGFNVLYQFADSFGFLILSAVGLAIIFGMMGIINLAHGEFIMLGAYVTTMLAVAKVPLPLAIMVSSITIGLFGLIVDRLLMKHLYGRPLDSVVATWGISLILGQGILILLGPSLGGVSTPLGSFNVGNNTYSLYRVVLFLTALGILALIYWIFMYTKFGLQSRATMQNHEIASSLGVNTDRIYTLTFMFGSALAGLTGGLYAPTMSISPTLGSGFIMQSFVTVIVGGANPLVGTVLSGGTLGVVNSILSSAYGTFIGRVGLLVVAILFIRLVPSGFSGIVERKVGGR